MSGLSGPRVRLVPASAALAAAVCSGEDPADALGAAGLRAGAGWPHADSADALRPVADHPEDDAALPYGVFLVLDEQDQVVGEAAVTGPVDAEGDLEVAYGLARPSRGQGLALEAVAVLLAWADRQDGVRRVVARVRPGNEASTRLLLRLGFAAQGGAGADGHVLWVRGRAGRSGVRVTGRHVC